MKCEWTKKAISVVISGILILGSGITASALKESVDEYMLVDTELYSNNQIRASWLYEPNYDKLELLYSTNKESNYKKVESDAGSSAITPKLKDNTTYYLKFKVTYANEINYSGIKKVKTHIIPKATEKPVAEKNDKGLTLSWAKSKKAVKYNIYIAENHNANYTFYKTSNTNSLKISEVDNLNGTYFYKIEAVSADGGISEKSDYAKVAFTKNRVKSITKSEYNKKIEGQDSLFKDILLLLVTVGGMEDIDSDGDGLIDAFEIESGLNPYSADTDGDGFSDFTELCSEMDPLTPLRANTDTDGDGIPDIDEILLYQTNPLREDSDNDGLSDYEEIMIYKTDPNYYDSDGDFLSDGEEIKLGLDPLKKKTDGKIFDNERIFTQKLDKKTISNYNTYSKGFTLISVNISCSGTLEKSINLSKAHEYDLTKNDSKTYLPNLFSMNFNGKMFEKAVVTIQLKDEYLKRSLPITYNGEKMKTLDWYQITAYGHGWYGDGDKTCKSELVDCVYNYNKNQITFEITPLGINHDYYVFDLYSFLEQINYFDT